MKIRDGRAIKRRVIPEVAIRKPKMRMPESHRSDSRILDRLKAQQRPAIKEEPPIADTITVGIVVIWMFYMAFTIGHPTALMFGALGLVFTYLIVGDWIHWIRASRR